MSGPPLGDKIEPYVYSVPSTRLLYKPLDNVQGGGCWADVFVPEAEQPAEGWPVVIIIHGGAFTVGSTCEQPSEQIDRLLAHGLACVDIEYRLAPHADITQMNDDCLDAHRWIYSGALNKALASATKEKGEERLDKPPKINVDRISAAGYSAGGYLAAMLGHTASPPLKSVLLFYGLFQLVICGTTPRSAIYLGLSDKEQAFLRKMVDGPALTSADHERERPGPRRMWMTAALVADALLDSLLPVEMINTDENRRSLSPLFLATSAYPPTFLIAPQLDTLIAPTQAYLMADRLKELGVEAIVRRANYAPHAYDRKGGKENATGGQWWDECTLPGLDFLIART